MAFSFLEFSLSHMKGAYDFDNIITPLQNNPNCSFVILISKVIIVIKCILVIIINLNRSFIAFPLVNLCHPSHCNIHAPQSLDCIPHSEIILQLNDVIILLLFWQRLYKISYNIPRLLTLQSLTWLEHNDESNLNFTQVSKLDALFY